MICSSWALKKKKEREREREKLASSCYQHKVPHSKGKDASEINGIPNFFYQYSIPNSKTKQIQYKKTHTEQYLYEHRSKYSQQNISKLNPKRYKKNYVPQPHTSTALPTT